MKNTMSCGRRRRTAAVAVMLTGIAASASAQGFTPPGGPGDYLITVGKRAVWASQAPKKEARSAPSTPAAGRDYLVTVGKRPVWASTVRRPATTETDSTAQNSSRGRFVTVGKATFWVEEKQKPSGQASNSFPKSR